MLRRLGTNMTSLFPFEKGVQLMYLLGRELNIPLFVTHVTYALVTLTFQDPVQTGEHRIQSRILALGVITLILGHHPDKHPWHDHDQSDLKKRFLCPFPQ